MNTEMVENRTYLLPKSSEGIDVKKGANIPVYLLVLYLIIEYGRPQFLAPVKPGLVLQFLLILCLSTHTEQVRRLFKEKYFMLFVTLLLFMSVHVFIATNNFWAFVCLKTLFSYLIISISCCVFLNNTRRLSVFLFSFVMVVALCSVNRILKIDFLGFTGSGVFTDENDFALAMNVALPFGFFLGQMETGVKRWILWSACIALVLGNVVSASRGGIIGLAAVGFVCWCYSKHKVSSFFVIVAVAMLAWGFADPEFKQEVSGISIDSAEKDTGKDRIELWKVGLKAFAANPIIGVGQGNIPIVINQYQYDSSGKSYWDRDMWGRALHSVYFTLLAELGLVGTVLVGLMFRELLRKHRKILNTKVSPDNKAYAVGHLNRALMTSLFGFLVTGIFLSVFYYPPLWNIAALFMTLSLIAGQKESEPA
ncbi:O-antigen ligase family protein [Pelotalea chapellei]|uniref:O-antigen ligase family protein n=1 Tax=Pelotalea chapellei TaxID=44671 RepID=A0ABS5U845_9BACT|nr:O-antigen ligase family protein [Pelotalea chapellei]MBT1071830.1 O-antigen ligase family protein [Pelotalea chapellei]